MKSKRDHKLQDKGDLAIMMGIYPKIPNGIVALRIKDGKLGELCTAHCSSTHVEDSLRWLLKRDPNNPTRRVYMSSKGEATWDIPISSLPTVEEKEVWNRHPTFVSLQRSRDGWAWYTANIGRLLPSYRDIEVEDGEDPMPYLGDAGFHSYAQLPQIEADPVHDVNLPAEIPFVPQSMLEDDFQPELPPPPARGPRHIQGDIRLPAAVRDEIAHAERVQPEMENVPDDQVEDQTLGRAMDTTLTQPVELQSPAMVEERSSVPQMGGGYMISTNLKQDPHPQHNHLFRSPQHHFSVNLHQMRVRRRRKLQMIRWTGFNKRNR